MKHKNKDNKGDFKKDFNKNSDQKKYKKSYGKKTDKREEVNKETEQTVRLNKYIANAGVCSRREADRLISDGHVKVNSE